MLFSDVLSSRFNAACYMHYFEESVCRSYGIKLSAHCALSDDDLEETSGEMERIGVRNDGRSISNVNAT